MSRDASWGWLAATYAGWRIVGSAPPATPHRQELVVTLVRRGGGRGESPGAEVGR
ncbi:hypothetical protein [Tepidiforma sp.]|uniref:hypothetical protein n=1 Tax=Tepidiforma sp. TaxID=2682230 RepID=UPI002585936E|nr:hypothetical protein [Tepidiforma sp.]